MRVRFLEPARRELDETISYYNTELAGLGEAFLFEVLSAIERIRQYPKAWHPLSENTRRCRLKRFHYGLIYAAGSARPCSAPSVRTCASARVVALILKGIVARRSDRRFSVLWLSPPLRGKILRCTDDGYSRRALI